MSNCQMINEKDGVRRACIQYAVDEQNGGILFEGGSYETDRREALEHNEQTVGQVQEESKD